MLTWQLATELLGAVNKAYEGLRANTKEPPRIDLYEMTEAQQGAWRHALHLCSPLSKERRRSAATGAQSAAALLKVEHMHIYGPRARTQVPFKAELVTEPQDDEVAMMLDALPEEESRFYSGEENVVEWGGKSYEMLTIINKRYGFLGGT